MSMFGFVEVAEESEPAAEAPVVPCEDIYDYEKCLSYHECGWGEGEVNAFRLYIQPIFFKCDELGEFLPSVLIAPLTRTRTLNSNEHNVSIPLLLISSFLFGLVLASLYNFCRKKAVIFTS